MIFDLFPDKISKWNTFESKAIRRIQLTGGDDDLLWNCLRYSSLEEVYRQIKSELDYDRDTRKKFNTINSKKKYGYKKFEDLITPIHQSLASFLNALIESKLTKIYSSDEYLLCIAAMDTAVKNLSPLNDFPGNESFVGTVKEDISRLSEEWKSMIDRFGINQTTDHQVSPDVIEYFEKSAQSFKESIEQWLKNGFFSKDYDSSSTLKRLTSVIRRLKVRQFEKTPQHLLVIIQRMVCSLFCIIYLNSLESSSNNLVN